MNEAQVLTTLAELFYDTPAQWCPEQVCLTSLVPDGSNRQFFRIEQTPRGRLVVILPPPDDEQGRREADSFWAIGTHLYQAGVPVPEVYGYQRETGLIVCEDLGTERLYDLAVRNGWNAETETAYVQTVGQLVVMQVAGARDFNSDWCWDTPVYDQALMLSRESKYFLQACCEGYLGLAVDWEAIYPEFVELAARAAAAPANFFLHRDFQSRNIMWQQSRVGFIDFQGGRKGPLAYDLASLLIDPYVGLALEQQQYLVEVYCDALEGYLPYDRRQFLAEYELLALQRNLQILGAFSFLSTQRKKPFFARYIGPALRTLAARLAKPEVAGYAALRHLIDQCCKKFEKQL